MPKSADAPIASPSIRAPEILCELATTSPTALASLFEPLRPASRGLRAGVNRCGGAEHDRVAIELEGFAPTAGAWPRQRRAESIGPSWWSLYRTVSQAVSTPATRTTGVKLARWTNVSWISGGRFALCVASGELLSLEDGLTRGG